MNDQETREFLGFVKNLSRGRWFAMPRLTTGELIVRQTPAPGAGALEVFRVPKGESLGAAKERTIKAMASRARDGEGVSGG